jgi:hypothetical protein
MRHRVQSPRLLISHNGQCYRAVLTWTTNENKEVLGFRPEEGSTRLECYCKLLRLVEWHLGKELEGLIEGRNKYLWNVVEKGGQELLEEIKGLIEKEKENGEDVGAEIGELLREVQQR